MDTEVDVIYPHIKDGLTPLMMLTSYNNSDTFRQCFDALLQRDEINVCVQEEKGINALHCLFLYNCKNVTVDIIRQLAQRGIDLTSVDRVENRSVLHYLCLYGHECEDFCNVIRFLVECGLNVQAKTKKGDSALTLLCQHYSGDQLLEATRFLIDHSSGDGNHKNDEGKNALHYLCENEDFKTDGFKRVHSSSMALR